jgi:hypothetical protein
MTINQEIRPIESNTDSDIFRYCEIIYEMLEANPNLYEELLPKCTFKFIGAESLQVSNDETLKQAA